jgi:dCMP deaminase
MTSTSNPFVKSDRPTWCDTWFDVAETIARRSLCTTQVGAVITDKNNRPISVGYNGPPKGFYHHNYDCRVWCKRSVNPSTSYDDCPSLHAEQNALITADKSTFQYGRIYVTSHICMTCAKLIANSGLVHVYVNDASRENYNKRNAKNSYEFLRDCNVGVILTEMNENE